jgi:ATP-dependent protease ClpP protease subunit
MGDPIFIGEMKPPIEAEAKLVSLDLVTPRSLVLELHGAIGKGEPINFASIERKIDTPFGLQHVHLDLDCTGGNISEAMRIYEMLRALPCPVSAHVSRRCYSAGVDLFLAASLRSAALDAEILIHQSRSPRNSLPEEVTTSSLAPVLDRLRECDERAIRLIQHRTGACRHWIQAEIATEELTDLAAAVEHGLIHTFGLGGGMLDSNWPAIASQAAKRVWLPSRVLTPNFFEGCNTLARIEALREPSSSRNERGKI